jgi:hypothetical protein
MCTDMENYTQIGSGQEFESPRCPVETDNSKVRLPNGNWLDEDGSLYDSSGKPITPVPRRTDRNMLSRMVETIFFPLLSID